MPNYRNNAPDYMRHSANCGCHREMMPEPRSNCGCSRESLSDFALAMAYVPWQNWNCPYAAEKALHCGTIFKELDKPFRGIGGCNR